MLSCQGVTTPVTSIPSVPASNDPPAWLTVACSVAAVAGTIIAALCLPGTLALFAPIIGGSALFLPALSILVQKVKDRCTSSVLPDCPDQESKACVEIEAIVKKDSGAQLISKDCLQRAKEDKELIRKWTELNDKVALFLTQKDPVLLDNKVLVSKCDVKKADELIQKLQKLVAELKDAKEPALREIEFAAAKLLVRLASFTVQMGRKSLAAVQRKCSFSTAKNEFVALLMMDKFHCPQLEDYGGLLSSTASSGFGKMVERLDSGFFEKNKDLNVRKVLTSLKSEASKLFFMHESLALIQKNEPKKFPGQVLKTLKNLSVGERVLIPLGCKGHATDLLIEKTSNSTFRLVHFNTGFGIDRHYNYKGTHLYQTFDVMDAVPTGAILNEDSWSQAMTFIGNQEMNAIYDWIDSTIGKGGVRAAPSQYKEDYEACQNSGSCALQSKMAFMRYEIMRLTEGTPQEKEACYKLVKAYFFKQYLNDYGSNLDDFVEKNLPIVKEKLEAEMTLVSIAADPERTNEAIFEFQRFMGVPFKCNLTEQDTLLARYALLRNLSKKATAVTAKHPEKYAQQLERCNPALGLVAAKWKMQLHAKKNIDVFLRQTEPEETTQELIFIMFRTPHARLGIDEAAKRIGEELSLPVQPDKTRALLKGIKTQKNEIRKVKILEKLYQAIIQKDPMNGRELAEKLKSEWEKVSS